MAFAPVMETTPRDAQAVIAQALAGEPQATRAEPRLAELAFERALAATPKGPADDE